MSDGGEARKSRLSTLLQRLSTRISFARQQRVELPDPALEADVRCEDHPECDFECYKCRDAWYRFMQPRPLGPEEQVEMMARWEAAAKNQPR
jgi:hypothetical protein